MVLLRQNLIINHYRYMHRVNRARVSSQSIQFLEPFENGGGAACELKEGGFGRHNSFYQSRIKMGWNITFNMLAYIYEHNIFLV